MNQYSAHLLASTRRTELAAEAAASRLAASARESRKDQLPPAVRRRLRTHQPATA